MIGTQLSTFCTSLNGDSSIEPVLLTTLVNIGKTILESERDWMVLRKTDTSITVPASANAWNTPISISGIIDFLRFYGEFPVRIFDGANGIEGYRQVPFSRRLEYKDVPGTFVHDIANKRIYINGNVAMGGTLYLNYIKATTDIDLTAVTDMETDGTFPFPARFHPVLGFYAVGINKGAVDYDDINRQMLPQNQATLVALKSAMEAWDTKMQLSEIEQTDPSGNDMPAYRSGAINMNL